MISFRNVSVRYPLGNVGLSRVNLDIQDNEFIYLVGPSGSGKTTLMRLLLYELAPTEGAILRDGHDVTRISHKAVIKMRQGIGIVFQDFKILPDKDVFENIAISMYVKGFSFSEIRRQVVEAASTVGISNKLQMFPIQLSAGELQRVAIARAIIGDRNIILADEPTGNLDPRTTWDVMKLFRELGKTKTILFATHNTDIVNSMKRRVIVLKSGEIIKDIKRGGYEL